MIRVWNYNKSRIHSYRGARYIEILLDERPVFKGEIQKAPGMLQVFVSRPCTHTPTHLHRIVQINSSCKSPRVLRISIAPVHPRILIGDIFASLGLLKNFGELRRVLKRMLRTSYSH